MSIESRVNLGINLLDRDVPAWQERVNPAILDIASLSSCPLAQAFGSYMEGCLKLGIWDNTEAQKELGFDSDNSLPSYYKDVSELTEEWKRRLARSS